jgi:hypothetical protein
MLNETNAYAKQVAERLSSAGCAAQTPMTNRAYYGDECKLAEPFTLRGEAEQKVGYHRTEADKADQAAAFFRENPAFDEFIRLIRSGAIQL